MTFREKHIWLLSPLKPITRNCAFESTDLHFQRWLFWINIPFSVIGLVMVPAFIRLNLVPGSLAQKLRRVDWLGNVIFIAAATSCLIPITWGGVQYPWKSWHTLVPLLIGIAGLVGFTVYEIFVATEPMVRLGIIRSYNMAYSLFATFVFGLAVYGALYFLPLYFEAVKGYNPIVAGVALFPATFTVAPVSIISGVIITKTGTFRGVIWLGWIVTTLGFGVTILLDVETTTVQWVFLGLCTGVGLGFVNSALALVNQAASDDSNMAFAISLSIFFRAMGQCIGVAICGVIFQNQMKAHLLAIPALASQASEYSKDASSTVLAIKSLPNTESKRLLIQAYADSLKILWVVLCALSGVAMLGGIFLRKASLDRNLSSEQGLRKEGTRNGQDLENTNPNTHE